MSFHLPDSPDERLQLVQSLEDQYRFLARKLDTDKRDEARFQIIGVIKQLQFYGMEHVLVNVWAQRELRNPHRRGVESQKQHVVAQGKVLAFRGRRTR